MRKALYALLGLALVPIYTHAQTTEATQSWPDTIQLQQVNISAPIPIHDNQLADFYRTNNFATIDNVNAHLSGISLIKRGAYAQEVQMHGFSAGQLNLTIDGMHIFGACTDKMDPITSYIEPTNLASISLNDGTSSNKTGCNIGGSVDFCLHEPTSKATTKQTAHAAIGYESISRGTHLLFDIGRSTQKWQWSIEALSRNAHNYTDGNGDEIPYTQYQKTNLHTVIKYQANPRHIFKIDALFDDAHNVGYTSLAMDVSKAQAQLYALEYRHNGTLQIKAKAYLNTIVHIMDDSQRDSLYQIPATDTNPPTSVYMRMDMPGRSTTIGSYLQLTLPYHQNHQISLQLDSYTNTSLAEMTMYMRYPNSSPLPPMYMQTWPENSRNQTGINLEHSSQLTQNWSLTANLRADYLTDKLLSPYGHQQFTIFNYDLASTQTQVLKSLNLSTQVQIGRQITLNASLGYGQRPPTITEKYGFYLYSAYDGYDYIGNPNLQPEQATHLQLNFQYNHPKIHIKLKQTASNIGNYILAISNPAIPKMNFYAQGIREYRNQSQAQIYGTDLQISYTPSPQFTLYSLTKYTRGTLHKTENLPLIEPLKTTLTARYQWPKISAQIETESAIAQHKINNYYGEQTTAGYTIINLKTSYRYTRPKYELQLSLGITNLLNRSYYQHLDWGRYNRPGRSIEFYLQLSKP